MTTESNWTFKNGERLSMSEAIKRLDYMINGTSNPEDYKMTDEEKERFLFDYPRTLFGTIDKFQISTDQFFDDLREFCGIEDEIDESDENEDNEDESDDESKENKVYTYVFGSPKHGVLDMLVFSTRENYSNF